MRKIIINGGKQLTGEVAVSGAKNSVVALIPATILADDIVVLDGVPAISDVDSLVDIMETMGANISTLGGKIVYSGPNQLSGAPVKATDLRAGAALVIAGLMAEGRTEITNIEFILRGYSNIIEKLTSLGADIQLVEE
ncbi:TPA: hypothetical protein ACGPFA_000829 [Streptococcus agalactiae]